MVVHADVVDQQPDIGFSQRRVPSPQLFADQLAELGDRLLANALRSSFELKRQAALAGLQFRDIPTVLGGPLGEQRILGRHQALLKRFQQSSYALFRCDFLPPDTIEILVPLCIRRIGFLEYGLQQFDHPENATGALASVPLKPMLDGLAVAPGFGMLAISTGNTERFGGNMDFNEVVEGNTVYLPVQKPGALLYFGDAHAVQNDDETPQYALETSMDVTVTVDFIKGGSMSMPRMESPTQIMVLDQAGSLDEVLKSASTGMIQWLQEDYGLTLSQSAQVLGTAMRYSVPNLAGRSVGMAAKIDKALLPAQQ